MKALLPVIGIFVTSGALAYVMREPSVTFDRWVYKCSSPRPYELAPDFDDCVLTHSRLECEQTVILPACGEPVPVWKRPPSRYSSRTETLYFSDPEGKGWFFYDPVADWRSQANQPEPALWPLPTPTVVPSPSASPQPTRTPETCTSSSVDPYDCVEPLDE